MLRDLRLQVYTPAMPGEKSGSKRGFAGLPAGAPPIESNLQDWVEWTLPKEKLGLRWDMEEQYQTFRMVELTPEIQHAAAKIAKDNSSLLQQELLLRSIIQVGDKATRNDRDFLEAWWRAIGPKCRMLITSAFSELVSVDEADTASFLASGRTRED